MLSLPHNWPPPQERARSSGINRSKPPTQAQRIDYTLDEQYAPPPVWPPPPPRSAEADERSWSSDDQEEQVAQRRLKRRIARRSNRFIDTDAGVDEKASADKDDSDDNPTIRALLYIIMTLKNEVFFIPIITLVYKFGIILICFFYNFKTFHNYIILTINFSFKHPTTIQLRTFEMW